MALTYLQFDVLHTKCFNLADGKEGDANANAVPQSSHYGIPQHCAHVFKERPCGHEVATVQDDGREHVKEEEVWGEDGRGLFLHWVHDATDNEADANQEAGLWDPDGNFTVNGETWK